MKKQTSTNVPDTTFKASLDNLEWKIFFSETWWVAFKSVLQLFLWGKLTNHFWKVKSNPEQSNQEQVWKQTILCLGRCEWDCISFPSRPAAWTDFYIPCTGFYASDLEWMWVISIFFVGKLSEMQVILNVADFTYVALWYENKYHFKMHSYVRQ